MLLHTKARRLDLLGTECGAGESGWRWFYRPIILYRWDGLLEEPRLGSVGVCFFSVLFGLWQFLWPIRLAAQALVYHSCIRRLAPTLARIELLSIVVLALAGEVLGSKSCSMMSTPPRLNISSRSTALSASIMSTLSNSRW